MQKWEYITIVRSRTWEVDTGHSWNEAGSWLIYVWRRAGSGEEWKGANFADLLCLLGDEGWEVVCGVPRSSYLGGSWNGIGGCDYAGFTDVEVYTLKRPKE